MESEIITTTSPVTSKAIIMSLDSIQYELLGGTKNEIIYSYFSKIKPWCLGQSYDYCPLMIIIMVFVILISILLIVILCIHNRKPYITRLLVNYIIKKKNDFINAIFCKKNNNSDNSGNGNAGLESRRQHSAIHNSVWWTESSNLNGVQRQAPPSYEESLNNVNAKPVYFKSILAPIVTDAGTTSSATSSGYSSRCNTATINNAFSIENLNEGQQVATEFRESGIDTVEMPINNILNYYENRRVNRNNLSFMSTDSFHYINTSNSSMPVASQTAASSRYQPSSVSLQIVPSSIQSTSTLRSELMNELPPDYDTVINAFKKVNDIDNLNKFKRLQHKYQQSANQSRRLQYQQRQQVAKQQQQQHRQSTATILSEVEIIV